MNIENYLKMFSDVNIFQLSYPEKLVTFAKPHKIVKQEDKANLKIKIMSEDGQSLLGYTELDLDEEKVKNQYCYYYNLSKTHEIVQMTNYLYDDKVSKVYHSTSYILYENQEIIGKLTIYKEDDICKSYSFEYKEQYYSYFQNKDPLKEANSLVSDQANYLVNKAFTLNKTFDNPFQDFYGDYLGNIIVSNNKLTYLVVITSKKENNYYTFIDVTDVHDYDQFYDQVKKSMKIPNFKTIYKNGHEVLEALNGILTTREVEYYNYLESFKEYKRVKEK